MSNLSENSSGSSRARSNGTVVGVPKKCWCGFEILPLMSNSVNNPHRRYYRCADVVAKKLVNDDHDFKWVDEGLLDEIKVLQRKLGRLEEMVKETLTERENDEKKAFEMMEMKLEKEIFERVEAVLVESKQSVKRMCIVVGIGSIMLIAPMKVIG
ncbi:hypothetical protein N665_0042s0031 [Sinapis alba]|nr:hypothetical protein N665_0042s0031 [Sinapis alba]